MKLFLDTNVVLDVLADRRPFVEDSARVLWTIEAGAAQGLIAAHTVTTLFYLLRKRAGPEKAKTVVVDLIRLVDVVPVDLDRILHALALGWNDLEDALQAACAEQAGADFLLTRDQRGFSGSGVRAISPAEFLALH